VNIAAANGQHDEHQATNGSSNGKEAASSRNSAAQTSRQAPTQSSRSNRNGDRDSQAPPPSRVAAPAASKSTVRRLQFIFEGSDGCLDLDAPVSRKRLFEKSISQLFAFVCERAALPQDLIDCMTFRCLDWGEGLAFVIRKSDAEQKWKDLQRRLNIMFQVAKCEFDEEDDFLVVVKQGDMRKRKREDDDDDDDDNE